MKSKSYFATQIYHQPLIPSLSERNKLNRQILIEATELAEMDHAGRAWSKKHYLNGFTSYASANELHKQSSTFVRLEQRIRKHALAFANELEWDLGSNKLEMTTCWVNIMSKNTHHGLHIHPLSVISGTYYVDIPKGTPGIKFEDPRLDKMMAAPPVRQNAKNHQHSTTIAARPGDLVLFESWLRHEVPINPVKGQRVSISFNYDWV